MPPLGAYWSEEVPVQGVRAQVFADQPPEPPLPQGARQARGAAAALATLPPRAARRSARRQHFNHGGGRQV